MKKHVKQVCLNDLMICITGTLPSFNPLSLVVRAECLHPYNIDKLPVHENSKTRQTEFF